MNIFAINSAIPAIWSIAWYCAIYSKIIQYQSNLSEIGFCLICILSKCDSLKSVIFVSWLSDHIYIVFIIADLNHIFLQSLFIYYRLMSYNRTVGIEYHYFTIFSRGALRGTYRLALVYSRILWILLLINRLTLI